MVSFGLMECKKNKVYFPLVAYKAKLSKLNLFSLAENLDNFDIQSA